MPRFRGLAVLSVMLLSVVCVLPLAADDNESALPANVSMIQDWSHRHLIFGGGGSLEALLAAARDPRARNQWLLRNHGLFQAARDSNRSNDPFALRRESGRFDDPFGIIGQGKKGKERPRKEALDIDWAFSLGATGGVAAGTFPAKFSFNVAATPDCAADFVVFPINATPGTGQANIVALQNLYVNTGGTGACSGTAPTVRWAYYVPSGGPVSTSPVLSLDGTKVAFIESVTGGAVFSVLTPGTGGSVTVPLNATSPSVITRLAYTPAQGLCTGPSAAANTRSSPFVDYATDTAYVGADNGYIYKIYPVFGGTPAVTACALVTAGSILTSPVYDPTAGRVFVADGAAASSLHAFPANLGTPATIAPAIGTITDGPIVDGTNSFVYVFGGVNKQVGNLAQVPWTGMPFSAWGTPAPGSLSGKKNLSAGTIRSGAFDNAYFTTGPKSGGGHLYACGYQGTASPAYSNVGLFGFTFANTTGLVTAGFGPNTNLAGSATTLPASCSPITSFYNAAGTAVDRMFVSTTQATSTTNYSFEMWNITNALLVGSTPSSTILSNTYTGGTSGIIVDNQGTGTDQSNVYFGTLATSAQCSGGYCAVKLTQSALQ
jgi:hypothetical protein